MTETTGRILRIEKTSIHDGDGLRTVVFLKGCPLLCKWCSSPESQIPEISHLYGTDMTTSEVMSEISKDEIFYFHSGGGVTLSGGEPLAQTDFCAGLLRECSLLGINTALETSMYGDFSKIEKLSQYTGAFYCDVKHMDSQIHEIFTGVPNKTILNNISLLSSSSYSGAIIIRIPIIPGINMNDRNAEESARFCASLKRLDYAELLPYHRLGVSTYKKIGKKYELEDTKIPARDEINRFAGIFAQTAPGINLRF